MVVLRVVVACWVRGRIQMRVVSEPMVVQTQFALSARPRGRAQHGGGDCTPDGEQHGKQQQQADTNGSHDDSG